MRAIVLFIVTLGIVQTNIHSSSENKVIYKGQIYTIIPDAQKKQVIVKNRIKDKNQVEKLIIYTLMLEPYTMNKLITQNKDYILPEKVQFSSIDKRLKYSGTAKSIIKMLKRYFSVKKSNRWKQKMVALEKEIERADTQKKSPLKKIRHNWKDKIWHYKQALSISNLLAISRYQ